MSLEEGVGNLGWARGGIPEGGRSKGRPEPRSVAFRFSTLTNGREKRSFQLMMGRGDDTRRTTRFRKRLTALTAVLADNDRPRLVLMRNRRRRDSPPEYKEEMVDGLQVQLLLTSSSLF
jgi:hypothetical protein